MRWVKTALAATLAWAAANMAQAQTDAATAPVQPIAEPPAAAAEAPASIRIPAGMTVQVELTEALSSRTSQQQQLFGLRLAEAIVIDGREIVPAGAVGGGEVIDAHASAFGGRQGRLIISGRYIEINGEHARIRGMQITAAGEDRGNAALAVSMIPYAGIAGIFVQGGEVNIPAGARGTARLAADVDIPLATLAAAPASDPVQVLEGENQQ
jgi:hypothetical protein